MYGIASCACRFICFVIAWRKHGLKRNFHIDAAFAHKNRQSLRERIIAFSMNEKFYLLVALLLIAIGVYMMMIICGLLCVSMWLCAG